MKICVFGAGAVGGYVAAHLSQVEGVEVSVVARGAHLAAIRQNGLRLETPGGVLRASIPASDRPAELGRQDVVFIALKSHQMDDALVGGLTAEANDVVPKADFVGIPHLMEGTHETRMLLCASLKGAE